MYSFQRSPPNGVLEETARETQGERKNIAKVHLEVYRYVNELGALPVY